MGKSSMMGSSKYEFEPNEFEEDIQRHIKEFREKSTSIKKSLENMILHDYKHQENFNLMIQNLTELGKEHNLI